MLLERARNRMLVTAGGQRAEVWALGLRNPWRYTFDSGNLYIAGPGRPDPVRF